MCFSVSIRTIVYYSFQSALGCLLVKIIHVPTTAVTGLAVAWLDLYERERSLRELWIWFSSSESNCTPDRTILGICFPLGGRYFKLSQVSSYSISETKGPRCVKRKRRCPHCPTRHVPEINFHHIDCFSVNDTRKHGKHHQARASALF